MVKKVSFVLLFLILYSTTIFAYTTISGNMSGITLTSGTYHVTGDLFVNDGTTFTLNPGVVLKFSTGKDLTIYGTLHAIGLNSPFIFFTSQNDDTIGETLPISTGNPQPGDWEGILFDGTTTNDGICAMKYCCVKFGGSSSGTILSNIKLEESDVCSIEYTITRFSEVHGIGIDTCSPDIVYNYVDHNLQSGIYIEGTCLSTISGNNIFDNSTSGLYISTYSSAPTVTSNTIDNNDPYPIVCYPTQVDNFSNNSFTGNTNQQINVMNGTITEDASWEDPGIPYRLNGTIYIQGQDGIDLVTTLTLEQGTVMEFVSTAGLYIGHDSNSLYPGALVAVGTAVDPITFTANTASPSPGYWSGIYFADYADDSICSMDYCVVEYGGYSSHENIYCYYSSPTISHSTIQYGSGPGIYCMNSDPNITGCTISNNTNYGVYCNMGDPLITDCTIQNNASYGVYISFGSNPTIQASEISNNNYGIYFSNSSDNATITGNSINNNQNYPIRCFASHVGNITGNTFTGNTYQQIYVYGNTISEDATWEDQGIPYYVSSSAHVYVQGTDGPDGITTLTLEPGVQLNFDSVYLWIGHDSNPLYPGALVANGTETDNITFTSNSATPAAGDWYGIYFADYADDNSELSYCTVEYGGASSSYDNIYLNGCSPTISHCEIAYGHGAGIYCLSSNATITDCMIHDNSERGIYLNNSNPFISRCFIYNNNDYGIYTINNSPDPFINNCTITAHTTGFYANTNSDATILNSILWGNTSYGVHVLSGCSLDMNYSDCQDYWDGTGNIFVDPIFKNSSIHDYSLSYSSPCIDTGDPASPLDPDSTRVDMGALYFNQAGGGPVITTISDIPDDQGRQVQIVWDKSMYDETGSTAPIVHYSIWRYDNVYREDKSSHIYKTIVDVLAEIDTKPDKILYWEKDNEILTFIDIVPAMGFEQYSVIAPTLHDSSNVSTYYSKFIIFAHTDVPLLYFASEPDSGYSVDNIPPCGTTATIAKDGSNMHLTWEEVEYGMFEGNLYPELNGVWYKIYAGDEPNFTCDQTHLIDIVTTLNYDYIINPDDSKKFFKIVVSDIP